MPFVVVDLSVERRGGKMCQEGFKAVILRVTEEGGTPQEGISFYKGS